MTFTRVKGWRNIDQMNDYLLYDKNNEFRANSKARAEGEYEYNRDFKKRKRSTEEYCQYIGQSYDHILRFNL